MIIFTSVGVVSLANCVASAVLMAYYFDGLKTVTTFITNSLLIGMRVGKSISIARSNNLETKAQSVNLTEPVTFNTIDPKYRIHPEEKPAVIAGVNPMVP